MLLIRSVSVFKWQIRKEIRDPNFRDDPVKSSGSPINHQRRAYCT